MTAMILASFNWFLIYSLLVVASAIAIRAGIFCLAVEGIYLTSAFMIAFISQSYNLTLFPILLAILSGILIGSLFILLTIKIELNEIIVGISVNLFCFGLSSYLGKKYYNSNYLELNDVDYNSIPFVITTIILVIFSYFLIDVSKFKSRFIAVGQSIDASTLANVSVIKYRSYALLLTSLLASAAGVFFFISQHGAGASQWLEGIGFVAIGVAFVTRNSILYGILISLVLSVLRTLTISIPATRGSGLGLLVQIAPFVFILILISTPPIFNLSRRIISRWKISQ